MKFIITENKFITLFEKLILTKYGLLTPKYSEIEEMSFFYDKDGRSIFELNDYGTFFVPESLVKRIHKVFGLSYKGHDTLDTLKETITKVFGVKIKKISIKWET